MLSEGPFKAPAISYTLKSLDEMGVIRSRGVDISQIVEDARNAVKGKSPVEALKAFVDLIEW